MVQIGNFFGSILGYLLWPLYLFFSNYGVAIILFTIIVKALMFPFSIKQQKSMAGNVRLQAKQKELQERYGDDKVRMNQEIQKLYEKEGVNPMGGCLPMLLPFPILIGVYYTVINPLSNVLHLDSSAVQSAISMLQRIPGVSSMFTNTYYAEMNLVRNYEELRPHLTMFDAESLSKIDHLTSGFDFLGLNLLGTPQGSPLDTFLWLVPVLCLASYIVSQVVSMRMQPGMQQQQGCMKVLFFAMPLFSAYIAFTLPAAVGFYWTVSALTSMIQTVVIHYFYSPGQLIAKAEAQRVALREQEEAAVKPLPAETQQELREQFAARMPAQKQNPGQQNQGKKKSPAKPKKKPSSSDDYLGTKK